jgi:hypothetical protein
VKALSRTYAQAIAGVLFQISNSNIQIPMEMVFNPDNSYFKLIYIINKKSGGPTEIYLNEALYYSNGFTVEIVPR